MDRLERATLKFSVLSNFIAMMGGKIKSKQMISGNMSDILSNIYLSYSLAWNHYHFHDCNEKMFFLRDECIHYLMNDLDYKMNLVISNYPNKWIRLLLCPLSNSIVYPELENKNKLYKMIMENPGMQNIFKRDIYHNNTIIEKMDTLRKIEPNSREYKELYQDIIKVGEFKI
jgi:hypothetical protein